MEKHIGYKILSIEEDDFSSYPTLYSPIYSFTWSIKEIIEAVCLCQHTSTCDAREEGESISFLRCKEMCSCKGRKSFTCGIYSTKTFGQLHSFRKLYLVEGVLRVMVKILPLGIVEIREGGYVSSHAKIMALRGKGGHFFVYNQGSKDPFPLLLVRKVKTDFSLFLDDEPGDGREKTFFSLETT